MDDKNLTPDHEKDMPSGMQHRRALRSPDALFSEIKEQSLPSEEEKAPLRDDPHLMNAPEAPSPSEMSPDTEALFSEKRPHTLFEDVQEDTKEKETEPPLSSHASVFDWIKSFLISLAIVIFIFTLIFRGVTVDGDSMLPTLSDKEYLIISDLLYTPEAGDIVVVQAPHYKNGTEPIIKRIIATGGQTVEINFNTWEIKVDGVLLDEPYILQDAGIMNAESLLPDENGIALIEVQENCIFIMGDNRNDSLDSRSDLIGQIDERYIMGRVLLRLTPVDRFGKVD